MGTNIYMRKIPTAKEKKQLKALLIKQHKQVLVSIDNDDDFNLERPNGFLDDQIESLRNQMYKVVHIGKCSWGWKFLFAPNPEFYNENKKSILKFLHRKTWQLFDEYGEKLDPDKFGDDYVTSHEDGWDGAEYDKYEREHGNAKFISCASYEHVTSEGLRFARDADFS